MYLIEPLVTKPTKWQMCPAKTQISLGILPVWSESSLSAWRKLGSLATQWAHSEDSDQTGQMPRLIWVFVGRTVILSWGGSCEHLPLSVTLPWHIFTQTDHMVSILVAASYIYYHKHGLLPCNRRQNNINFSKRLKAAVNFLNIRTPQKFVVITLKFELCGSTIE